MKSLCKQFPEYPLKGDPPLPCLCLFARNNTAAIWHRATNFRYQAAFCNLKRRYIRDSSVWERMGKHIIFIYRPCFLLDDVLWSYTNKRLLKLKVSLIFKHFRLLFVRFEPAAKRCHPLLYLPSQSHPVHCRPWEGTTLTCYFVNRTERHWMIISGLDCNLQRMFASLSELFWFLDFLGTSSYCRETSSCRSILCVIQPAWNVWSSKLINNNQHTRQVRW